MKWFLPYIALVSLTLTLPVWAQVSDERPQAQAEADGPTTDAPDGDEASERAGGAPNANIALPLEDGTITLMREDSSEDEDFVRGIGRVVPGLEETSERVVWREEWPRYQFDELVLTVGLSALVFFAEFIPTRGEPNWVGGSLLDDEPRRYLHLQEAEARRSAAIASDVLVTTLVAWPFVVDSLLSAGVFQGGWDVAWQMALISLESLVINQTLTVLARLLARRETPTTTACREDESYADDPTCSEPLEAESFWSPHTANAFAAASLICLQHDELDLWGSHGADGAMCATAMAAAGVTGALRLMADRNYLSDVLVGAAIGFLSGYLMPWLLHFSGGGRPALRGAPELPPIAVAPMVGDGLVGGMIAGAF